MNPDTALRPRTLAEYVGQPNLIARLRILVAAARLRGEPLGHILLSGGPGLGKTSIAYILANEMQAKAHVTMGPSLEKPDHLYALLGRLEPGDVLFIDEIHRVPAATAECLYPAMEDREMHLTLDCGRHVTLQLPSFTLVGATTQPGLLEAPLRERFASSLAMVYYSPADLCAILTVNAAKLGMVYDPQALALLASRSRGTPRVANNLLRFARDYSAVHADNVLSVAAAQTALDLQGIDGIGLTASDRDYLRCLNDIYHGGPTGAQALAATLSLTMETVASIIEPYMLSQGLIARTPRGRCITDKARQHLAAAA